MEITLVVVFTLFAVCVLAWVLLGDNTSVGIHTVKPKDPWEQVNRKSGSWKEYERPNYPKPPRPRTVSPSKPEGWK